MRITQAIGETLHRIALAADPAAQIDVWSNPCKVECIAATRAISQVFFGHRVIISSPGSVKITGAKAHTLAGGFN